MKVTGKYDSYYLFCFCLSPKPPFLYSDSHLNLLIITAAIVLLVHNWFLKCKVEESENEGEKLNTHLLDTLV